MLVIAFILPRRSEQSIMEARSVIKNVAYRVITKNLSLQVLFRWFFLSQGKRKCIVKFTGEVPKFNSLKAILQHSFS